MKGFSLVIVFLTALFSMLVLAAPTDDQWENSNKNQSHKDKQGSDNTKREYFGAKPIEEMTIFELQEHYVRLQEKDRKWKQRQQLREKSKEDRESLKALKREKALEELREVNNELVNASVNQAVKGLGAELPKPPVGTKESKDQPDYQPGYDPYSDARNYGTNPVHGDEYIDYVIDAPLATTGRPERKIKIKARRGVMELHKQVQDLNKVLIDNAARMIGKPL